MSSNSSSQTLPPREASLFKKILKHFKEKQFKNGLKVANQILSNPKYSEHGETLSMKGLILNSMGKKQEALDFVRRGLKNDVKSHVCWHVFGLLQKADHKYEEAIKCYRNALRLKTDSVQILSDLSLVQIQTRDLEGYRDSRYQLFSLRPGERSTWIGCAMAYHLTGDHVTAVNILSEYQKSNSNAGANFQNRRQINKVYEHSELLLYNVFILMECERYEEALTILDENENDIVDKESYNEYKAEIYLALGRYKDAQKVVSHSLLCRNPENIYYCQLQEKANQVSDDSQRLEIYNQLSELYPRSQTIARAPLNFVTDMEIFRQKMDHYLRKGFRKGQPAMFRDLKHLYNTELDKSKVISSFTYRKLDLKSLSPKLSASELDAQIKKIRRIKLPPKIEIIENLLLGYVENLKVQSSFDVQSTDEEAVTCLLWVYYFLAQHFDALKEFSMALYFANCALVHTPTLIDIFVIKAKILKHAGFPEKAVKYLDEAQSLDTSDRYLNSKCAKYLIRINKVKEAEEMCLKFTRESVPAAENLNEMQCMWFQTEMSLAYKRMGAWGEALKKCIEVDNHFAEINEDQFDFNTYCILKVTLRAYVQMIRLEDRLKSHNFFIKASKTAIEIYLSLYDKPASNKSETDDEANSKMSASELRKMRNKQRKAQLKANAEKENDKSQKKPNEKRDNSDKNENVEVIDVEKLEKSDDPLNDAMRFLVPLKIFGRNLIETHLLSFEVFFRKGKVLLQLQSLKRSLKLCTAESKFYPTILRQIALFLDFINSRKEQLSEPIRIVLQKELPSLEVFGFKSIEGDSEDILPKLPTTDLFVEKYLSTSSKSFLCRTENIQVRHYLAQLHHEHNAMNSKPKPDLPASDEIKSTLSALINDLDSLADVSYDCSLKFYNLVKSDSFGKFSTELVEQLREKFHSLYPYASRFMTEKEVLELETEFSLSDYFTADTEDTAASSSI